LYSQARVASETGLPIMRHLALTAPDDARVWSEDHSYTLGDDILVAPVVEPGARLRTLYLPPGDWVDWWSGDAWEGGRTITVEAPLERVPIFVRAGAILPLASDFHTLAPTGDANVRRWEGALVVRVVSARNSEGASRPIPAGSFRLYDGTVFKADPTAGSFALSTEGAPAERDLELQLPAPGPPSRVLVNGAPAADWSFREGVVIVRLRSGNFSAVVEYS
jgi:Glycosyl hydrolases family 31